MKIFSILSILCLTLLTPSYSATITFPTDTLDSVFSTATDGSADQKVYAFCQNVMSSATADTLQQARELVGQIIYLYERDKAGTLSLVNPHDVSGTKTKISLKFVKAMSVLSQELVNIKIAHQTTGLQNPSLAFGEYLPRIIARSLFTSSGKINHGIAQGLKKSLLPSASLDYQKDITRFLDLLDQIGQDPAKSVEWENILSSVVKPLSSTAPANSLIRTVLGLAPNTVITDRHTKEAFLYFFMGHARQGPVGDCFGEWWKILVKDGLWHTLARDGAQLFKYSGLLRTVSGVPQTFPFVYSIADDNLKTKVYLDQKGKLRTGASLFDAPGIKNAALQMGIADLNSVRSNILSLLLGTKVSDMKSAEEIIDTLASISIQKGWNSGKDLSTLANIGYFAFSSENTCAPLEVYGSSLASFAEELKGNAVRGVTLNAVERALDSQWNMGTLSWQKTTIHNFERLFLDTLNAQFELYYNARVELKTPSADGSSTAGAFEMHRTTGELIAGPEDFEQLVLDSLLLAQVTAQEQSKNNLISPMMFKWIQDSVTKITTYIQSSQNFLKVTLWNYSRENKQLADPVANWSQLEHTPWLDQTGNNPITVYEVATGMMLPKATSVVPSNARQLASSFLQFARNLEKTQHYLENPGFVGRIPVWNTIHAYTGLLDHPIMIDAVTSTLPVESWLSTRLYQPGHMVALSPLSKAAANTLVQKLAAALPKADGKTFLNRASLIYKDGVNVRDFSRQLIKTVAGLNAKYAGAQVQTQVSHFLTSLLLELLPKDRLMTLAQSAVQAFDTNWYDADNEQWQLVDERNIYFCFFFDPVSEDILFGTINEDNTELRFLDQYEWVIGQEWEFIPAVLSDTTSK